jgi:predicted dehydrogenase
MTINVGIIGCGSITEFRHAPEYAANPHVRDIVFYDRNPERAQRLAVKYGGRVAKSVEDLLEDDTIDAVSDCSSNETHHLITTQALLNYPPLINLTV